MFRGAIAHDDGRPYNNSVCSDDDGRITFNNVIILYHITPQHTGGYRRYIFTRTITAVEAMAFTVAADLRTDVHVTARDFSEAIKRIRLSYKHGLFVFQLLFCDDVFQYSTI